MKPLILQALEQGIGGGKLVQLKNIVDIENDGQTNVPIGIPEYNSDQDILEVYKNSILLYENRHYVLNPDKKSIDLLDFTAIKGDEFKFIVSKNVQDIIEGTDGSLILDGTISESKLDSNVQTKLNTIDNHINDTEIHVTSSEKNTWNNKLDSGDLKDASLTEKGIVQLSNELENSEDKAATPKSVKSVDDKLVAHLDDDASHGRNVIDGIRHQFRLGWNSTLGCLTVSIREV